MTPIAEIGPLQLSREDASWRITWIHPSDPPMELPHDFEAVLGARLDEIAASAPPANIVMDLQNATALSSRQLGILIALHKALIGRAERLPLVGVSAGVGRLLELTRTSRFFDYKPGAESAGG